MLQTAHDSPADRARVAPPLAVGNSDDRLSCSSPASALGCPCEGSTQNCWCLETSALPPAGRIAGKSTGSGSAWLEWLAPSDRPDHLGRLGRYEVESLIGRGGERVKLADFGLARGADELALAPTGETAGTPQYMSPEQAEGRSES